MTYKMKTKNLVARRWVLKQNKWHVSSIIIRSKLNLLTEPENKNKQAAWIFLLLSVNPTFLVREIFLKSSRILHEGFKLPLCTFHVVMQIQANFTSIAKSIFYDFYWLFLCLTSLALFLLLWLRLSFTLSFRNERKRVYKIAWQSKGSDCIYRVWISTLSSE